MGMLGDIIYPDNKEMAEELNKKYQQLLDNNALQNNLVNSYRDLASAISAFDAYLMATMCMQYVIVYDDEKLANLPETNTPKLTQSIADRIETYTMGVVSVYQVGSALKGMYNGTVNLYRNAGTYKAQIGEGYDAFKQAMQKGLDTVRLRLNPTRSSGVSELTEENSLELQEMGTELGQLKGNVLSEEEVEKLNEEEPPDDPELDGWEAVDSEVADGAAAATETAEVAEESSALASGATALATGAAAILGPIIAVVIVVTEIIGLVEAGETNQKLKDAETNMDKNLKDQQDGIDLLKKAFGSLSTCAIQDIDEYNALIQDGINLVPPRQNFFLGYTGYTQGQGFSHKGLDSYKTSLANTKDPLTNANTIKILQQAANTDLENVKACITAQAVQDSLDTQIIANMKKWLKDHSKTDIDDTYVAEAIDLFGVDKEKVAYCNAMRRYMNDFASKMVPYHKAISEMPQKTGTKTNQPATDPIPHTAQPDPTYDPDPSVFTLPA